jgi:hypothetical protein
MASPDLSSTTPWHFWYPAHCAECWCSSSNAALFKTRSLGNTFMKSWLRKIYPRLPVIKELLRIGTSVDCTRALLMHRFFQDHLNRPRYADRRKLNHYEHQVFSQNGEDGILAEIFRRIGAKDRFFVEFGVGNGLENNTTFLLTQNWRGAWIEGNSKAIGEIQSHFRKPLQSGQLKLLNSFITAENIETLFQQLDIPKEFDLLSLDIDRNTYHVWKALSRHQPRVIAVEYNATFPADVNWVAEYNSERLWNNSMYFGASLKAFEQLAAGFGYALVGCDLSGTNAFFVRNTERLDLFAEPFIAENHYEPPRYWSGRREGHARCFDDQTF